MQAPSLEIKWCLEYGKYDMCFTYKQNIYCLKHIRLSLGISEAPWCLSSEAKDIHVFFSLCRFFLLPPSLPFFLSEEICLLQ